MTQQKSTQNRSTQSKKILKYKEWLKIIPFLFVYGNKLDDTINEDLMTI
ncbi:hypothetical protein COTS27_01669 [Spirochaetota bacterium]|nr:hypothetical protein COTS27_01669 [Spirochaetota bacterium]